MNLKNKLPRGEWLYWSIGLGLGAMWIAGRAIYDGAAVREGYIGPRLLLAVGVMACAAGFWFMQQWARWLTLAIFAAASVYAIGATIVGAFSPLRLLILAPLALGGWYLWRTPLKVPDEEEDEEPFLSLVLLFREPHYLDASILAQLASTAWDTEVQVVEGEDEEEESPTASEESLPTLVGGSMPHFFCFHPPAFFTIHCFDEPYFEDPDEVAESVHELRAQQAVVGHKAWMSVDLIQWMGEEEDQEEAYRLIGRLLAELADENCLAVLDPVEGRIFVYDPETERKLRSDNPLQELQELYYAPIATIDGNNEAMKAAVEEARRRWPEFVAAFEDRGEEDDAPYLIKAPFYHEDNAEFMWVKVTGIENHMIYGELGNEPANIPRLHEGDRVRVKEDDVNDWMCVVHGKPLGGFTLKVLGRHFEDD